MATKRHAQRVWLTVLTVGLVLTSGPTTALAVDTTASEVQRVYRLVYAGPDGSGRVVVPQPPPGVTYVKWEVVGFDTSGRPEGGLLRSDGQMVGFGQRGLKAVEVVELEFPNVRFRDFTELSVDGAYVIFADGTVHRTNLMWGRKNKDWDAERLLKKDVLAGPWDVADCVIPAGGFVRFLPSPSHYSYEMVLLGTDGRVTAINALFAGIKPIYPSLDDGYFDRCDTTDRSDYVDGTILQAQDEKYHSGVLLSRDGRVDAYPSGLRKPAHEFPPGSSWWNHPKLPEGVRIIDLAGNTWNLIGYLRSDDKVVYRGDGSESHPVPVKQQPPPLPTGLKYVSIDGWYGSWIVMRSDGQTHLIDGGYNYTAEVMDDQEEVFKVRPHRYLPSLVKGWRYLSGAIPRNKETVFLVEKIPAGQKVDTGIEQVKTPKSTVKGKTVKVTVKVASRAVLDGGTVKVSYKGKTIGKAKVKGSKAVIKVKTKTMRSNGKNTISVQYLGNNQANKSTKTKNTLTTRR